MQQAKAFLIDAAALATQAEPADRVVNVNHFVPYVLPTGKDDAQLAMTPNQKDRLARYVAFVPAEELDKDIPKDVIKLAKSWRSAAEKPSDKAAKTSKPGNKSQYLSQISIAQQVQALMMSEFGFMFLDRTRIRPMGFALGEHLTSISLAPGEEVTIEQRTFTKYEQSFEEASEEEKTKDAEISSNYTTEISESLDWQTNLSKKSTNTSGGKVTGSYEGVGVEASTQTAADLTDGDQRTARASTKMAETNSRKVASKHRQQHKVVMKISQESRFETSSKRIIKNSNALAPIDLVYFKIMQRLRLAQERYGVRLCWAPTIGDPAGRFFAALEQRKQAFMQGAMIVDVGPQPVPPTPPATMPAQTASALVNANQFDPVWGGQSADYSIDIAGPVNYTWDRQPVSLLFSFTASRPAGARILNTIATASGVRLFVHVGIEDCRNPFKPQFWQPTGTATIEVTAGFVANPNSAADQQYTDKFNAYLTDLAAWQALKAAAETEARNRAETAWAQIRAEILKKANIVQEVMGALIEQAFPRQLRDEPWELDYWERLFDFDNVTVRFYPGWWSSREARDADSGATSFLNASWARAYIPVRPGSEVLALRWLLARRISTAASPAIEALIRKVIGDLRQYRIDNFGGPDELTITAPATPGTCPGVTAPYRCLASWEELVPTDGTHLEVLQATTSAADDDMAQRLQLQNDLQAKKVSIAAKDAAIKDIVAGTTLGGLTSHVEINVPEIKEE